MIWNEIGIAECEARVPVASTPALWPILMRQVAALFRFSDKPTRPSDDEGSRLTDPPFMGFRDGADVAGSRSDELIVCILFDGMRDPAH